MECRRVTAEDWNLVQPSAFAAFSDLKNSCKREVWQALDFEKALTYLLGHPDIYLLNGRWLVAYDLVTPWFSNERWLSELIALRVAPEGSFKEVTDFFDREARANGCSSIMAGTFFASKDDLCAALYRRNGYQRAATGLVRRIEGCASEQTSSG